MRTFFVFLLVLNLLFAAWQYFNPAKSELSVKPLPESLTPVRLINEAKEGAPLLVQSSAPIEKPLLSLPEPMAQEPAVVDCYTLGPFKDEGSINKAKKVLAERLDRMAIRKIEESERHRYWVYLPALENRKAAIAKSKDLAKRKIKDYYIVRSGEHNNGISLGHFKEKSHADRRVKKLIDLGFNAKMDVIYRRYNLYWLDYEANNEIQEHDVLIDSVTVDGVSRLTRACK